LNEDNFDGTNGFKRIRQKRGFKDSGINISIRHINTFLKWLYCTAKYINVLIKVKQLPIGNPLPRYLSENELKEIYSLEWLEDFYKNAFYFLESTGCRPSEPFEGELMGNWLIVDEQHSKGKSVRQIKLDSEQKSIYFELIKFRDKYKDDGSNSPNETAYHRLATVMRKVVKHLGFDGKKISLKSFRHTYGIKRLTVTSDIYQVSREMGHSSTKTTEIYLQYPEQRRLDDFPSLKKYIDERENERIISNSVTKNSVTNRSLFLNSLR